MTGQVSSTSLFSFLVKLSVGGSLLIFFFPILACLVNIAGVELVKRFENMTELMAQNRETNNKLTTQLDAATSKVEALKKQLSQVHTNFELEIQKSSAFSIQLEADSKKLAELENRSTAAMEEGRGLGVREFLKSDNFMADLPD